MNPAETNRAEQLDTVPPVFKVRWLGRQEYRAAWQCQQLLAAQRAAGEISDTLLLLEHPPTITLGRAASGDHLLASPDELARMGIVVVETDRGGDITYHGPGQLVGYPILDLREPPHTPDLHRYLRQLEDVLIQVCAALNVPADRFPGYTGVWTPRDTPHPAKIAAIGIKASRWITQHGFALNVCPDLSHFDAIIPCGIRGYGVTSLQRLLDRPLAIADVLPVVTTAFADVFGYAVETSDMSLC